MSVTFALLCYNQRDFVRDAVRGALAQEFDNLEVLIVDNHSTDGTYDIIQEEVRAYTGPHSLRVIRQDENIGWQVFPFSAEAASGEFMVFAHGDDVSFPKRTRTLVQAWRDTNASILSSDAEVIDECSKLLSFLALSAPSQWVKPATLTKGYTPLMLGAALASHADVFRKFSRLTNERLHAAYDHVLPFRGALLNGSYYVSESLLRWRVHGKNYGLQGAERTKGNVVLRETSAAHDIGARICMLDDLDELARTEAGRADLAEIRERLVLEILNLVRYWSRGRNTLLARGERPTWISQAEMEGRPNYAKGYGKVDQRLKWLPNLLRRPAGRLFKTFRGV
jgi:glycosyltransferase involved in cell wall biosynthesis